MKKCALLLFASILFASILFASTLFASTLLACLDVSGEESPPVETLNREDDGYRGIWYMNQPSGDQYVYKYSGGLGTYCAKHNFV